MLLPISVQPSTVQSGKNVSHSILCRTSSRCWTDCVGIIPRRRLHREHNIGPLKSQFVLTSTAPLCILYSWWCVTLFLKSTFWSRCLLLNTLEHWLRICWKQWGRTPPAKLQWGLALLCSPPQVLHPFWAAFPTFFLDQGSSQGHSRSAQAKSHGLACKGAGSSWDAGQREGASDCQDLRLQGAWVRNCWGDGTQVLHLSGGIPQPAKEGKRTWQYSWAHPVICRVL